MTVQSNGLGGSANSVSIGSGLSVATQGLTTGSPSTQIGTFGLGESLDLLFGLSNTTAVSFNPLVFGLAGAGNPGTATITVFDQSDSLLGSLSIPVAGFTNPTTFFGVVAGAGETIGRINIFTTSTNDPFSGEDNISVYIDPNPTNAVPEPFTIVGSLIALGGELSLSDGKD